MLEYAFWYFIIELCLHIFYPFALQKNLVGLVSQMDLWTLAGLGFSVGQFFQLMYVFLYGFTRPFVKADGIEAPNHPKWIGRIHLYSDMWRYFDPGLYKFMVR